MHVVDILCNTYLYVSEVNRGFFKMALSAQSLHSSNPATNSIRQENKVQIRNDFVPRLDCTYIHFDVHNINRLESAVLSC